MKKALLFLLAGVFFYGNANAVPDLTKNTTRKSGIIKSPEFLAYMAKIKEIITDHWRATSPKEGLIATVQMNMSPNGELSSIDIIKSSGDEDFDKSVIDSLKAANPLPAPPSDVYPDFKIIRMTFNPADL